MTQILGNLSKNIANPSIRSMSTSSICSVPPFVHPSFPLSVQSISVRPPVLSVHLLCPSVRPSGNSLHSIRPLCTVRSFAQFVCPSVHLFVCPSALSINPDRPVCLSVQSFHLFIRPSLCPPSLSVRPIRLSINSPDGNESGKKINTLKLAKQQFCMCIALFVHFFAVGARLQRETSIFHAFFTLLSN